MSPNDLSKRLADLFEAKSHQQQVLSDSMKSKIEAMRSLSLYTANELELSKNEFLSIAEEIKKEVNL